MSNEMMELKSLRFYSSYGVIANGFRFSNFSLRYISSISSGHASIRSFTLVC